MIIAMRFYWMFDYFIFCCCSTDLIACYTQPVSVVHRCFSHSHFVASYRAESRLSSHRTLIDCGRGTAYGTLCDVRSVTSQSTHRIYHASITNIIDNHSRLRHIYRFGCVSAFAHTYSTKHYTLVATMMRADNHRGDYMVFFDHSHSRLRLLASSNDMMHHVLMLRSAHILRNYA